MSGHSKWSTIKRSKGAADIKRGLTFTKIANAITIATKQGGSGDPSANPRLRSALEAAKAVNMPKDNVQRAIDRGLGKLPGQTLEEVTYEGFGPGKVAFIVEGVTDNRLRTNQEIKSVFEKNGGGLGSVGYMFRKMGEIKLKSQNANGKNKEDEILELIDLGAEDVEDFEEEDLPAGRQGNIQRYLVYVEGSELNTMGTKCTQAGYEVESQELVMRPNTLQKIEDPELAKKVVDFAGKLEDLDDVQKVFSNFDIADEMVDRIS